MHATSLQSKASKYLQAAKTSRSSHQVVFARTGGRGWGTGEENAAQVKRLISRDKKEFLGNTTDILDKYTNEFGDDAPSSSGTAGSQANPFAASAPPPALPASNPFGSVTSTPANPFGSAPTPSPFKKSSIEPSGLRPDMSPDPLVKETPISFLQSITLTQVVLFLSFTTIIGIMLGTFKVVLSSGAIRLAGIE